MSKKKKEIIEIIPGLGLDKEKIEGLIVDRAIETFAGMKEIRPTFAKKTKELMDAEIERIGNEAVAPVIRAMIEAECLQKTNSWGEKVGPGLTFKEYLVHRADAYMREPVDYEGKPRTADSYQFKASGERLAMMIDKYIHYTIESAVKTALAGLNDALGGALAATVKIKLKEVLDALQVNIKVKS